MVYLPGTQTQARRVNPGQLLEMFDSSWRVRNIWDGVRLEVVEDPSPVVLHSFTHLDPDLPLVEVSRRLPAGRGMVSGDGQEKRRCRVGRIMRFVVIRTMLWGQIDDSGWIDLYDSTVSWFDLRSSHPEEFVHTENTSFQSFLLHFQSSPL